MRICRVLLSPTFGMHQYTTNPARHDVHLVTTACFPRDRCVPEVTAHTPVEMMNTAYSSESLLQRVRDGIAGLDPDVVHSTGLYVRNMLSAGRVDGDASGST